MKRDDWLNPKTTSDGKIIVPIAWEPRGYQFPLWNYMENGGKRAVAVWHRRGGKDTTALNITVTQALMRPGLYWHLLPTYAQGKKIVWDGRSKEGRPMLSYWPDQMIKSINNTEMKIELTNDSIWQVVGTDNVDRLVGANPVGCVFSEYSLQDPAAWDYIRPILAENDGWAIFIYTPRGNNHGRKLFDMAKKNAKWFSELLTRDDTEAISEQAIQDERDSGMDEETIQQEFYCSFHTSLKGAYYARQFEAIHNEKRITSVPWVPQLPVHTAWDLGMNDMMFIWMFQIVGQEIHVIDVYHNSGEGLEHYAKELHKRPYMYSDHFAPHDIKVRELGTGKSRYEVAWKLGVKFKVVKNLPLLDGIQAVRNILPRCWFDEKKTEYGVEALKQYTKKFDETTKQFMDHPDHNWTSHPADAFRIGALGLNLTRRLDSSKLPRVADSDYGLLSF